MNNRDELDKDFRVATHEVRGAPVRWNQVEKRVRRHKLVAFRSFGALVLAFTIAIACGFIAVKLLVDPAYRAQLSSANTTVTFGEGAADLGHTQLGKYIREAGVRLIPTDTVALREEGFVFRAKLRLVGFRNRLLSFAWALRSVTSGQRVVAATYASPMTLRPSANSSTTTLQVWISYPQTTGRYRVDFILRGANEQVLNVSESQPFTVAAPRVSTPYQAPGYDALLPLGWRFTEKYAPASPGRFVTRMVGPMGLSVLIDTTRHTSGDPARSAKTIEDLYHGLPGYRRVEFHRTGRAGASAFEWSFEFEGLRRTDILFYRGGDGYGVLAVGSPRRSAEIRAVALEVARSILSRPYGK
jgi:hypothetical protein